MNWEGLVELKKINPLTPRDWPWPEILQTYTNGITLAKMIVIMFIWINYTSLSYVYFRNFILQCMRIWEEDSYLYKSIVERANIYYI